jgi:hypothetical protein
MTHFLGLDVSVKEPRCALSAGRSNRGLEEHQPFSNSPKGPGLAACTSATRCVATKGSRQTPGRHPKAGTKQRQYRGQPSHRRVRKLSRSR